MGKRHFQKSHEPGGCGFYFWLDMWSYLWSPAVAWVQDCCVVLQWPLIQADVLGLIVTELQEEMKCTHQKPSRRDASSQPPP